MVKAGSQVDEKSGGGDKGVGLEYGAKGNYVLGHVRNRKLGEATGHPLINFLPGSLQGLHLWRGSVGNERWSRIIKSGAKDEGR